MFYIYLGGYIMFNPTDVPFLAMCIVVNTKESPKPSEKGVYFTYGGFINFYNGNYLYAVVDCDFTRKYLESKGLSAAEYGKGPNDAFVATYDTNKLMSTLEREGPASSNYRKMVSYNISPVKDMIWGKLDNLGKRADGMGTLQKIASDFVQGVPHLNPHGGNDFLKTTWGKYSILMYAKGLGYNYFDEVTQMMVQKGAYRPNEFGDGFVEGLASVPSEYFNNILYEVENSKKSAHNR